MTIRLSVTATEEEIGFIQEYELSPTALLKLKIYEMREAIRQIKSETVKQQQENIRKLQKEIVNCNFSIDSMRDFMKEKGILEEFDKKCQ